MLIDSSLAILAYILDTHAARHSRRVSGGVFNLILGHTEVSDFALAECEVSGFAPAKYAKCQWFRLKIALFRSAKKAKWQWFELKTALFRSAKRAKWRWFRLLRLKRLFYALRNMRNDSVFAIRKKRHDSGLTQNCDIFAAQKMRNELKSRLIFAVRKMRNDSDFC